MGWVQDTCKKGSRGRSTSENLCRPMRWVHLPDGRRDSHSHCAFDDLRPCPEMVSPTIRGKSHIFSSTAAESECPERNTLLDASAQPPSRGTERAPPFT